MTYGILRDRHSVIFLQTTQTVIYKTLVMCLDFKKRNS